MTIFDRYRIPVVPRSLGMWYSLFGSHAWLRTAGSMYWKFGIRLKSSFWM